MILGISPANSLNTCGTNYCTNRPENDHKIYPQLIQRPLLGAQRNDTFERSTNISQLNPSLPVSFKGFACSSDNFAPKNLYDVPCASCGCQTILLRRLNAFTRDARDKKGEELADILQSKSRIYKKTEGEVVAQIIEHLKTHPDDNLLNSVRTLNRTYLENLEQSQIEILERVKKTAVKGLNATQGRAIAELVKNTKTDIKDKAKEPFKRKDFLEKLEQHRKSLHSQYAGKFEEICEIASTLPSSTDSAPAFFAKYSRRSSGEIAYRLLSHSLATTEHVIPKNPAYGGEDKTDNYIVMCGDCNWKRSSMPYTKWLQVQPGMRNNFKRYIAEITERIKIGELGEEYATYPFEVIKTVEGQSKGQITAYSEPHIDQIRITKGAGPLPRRTANFKRRLEDAEKTRDMARGRLLSLRERKQALQDDPEYKLIIEYHQIKHLLETKSDEKSKAEDELHGVEKSLLVNAARIKKKKQYEAELKTPGLKPAARKQTEQRLESVKKKLTEAGVESLKEREKALEGEIAELSRQILDLETKQEQPLMIMKIPETLMEYEKTLGKKEQTPDIVEQLKILRARRFEIQNKISDIKIDEKIAAAEQKYATAELCYQNLSAMSLY